MHDYYEKNKKRLTLVGSVLALVLLAGWAVAYFRGDPQLNKVLQLQEQLFAGNTDEGPPRGELWSTFQEESRKLNPAQRQIVRSKFEQHMEQRFDQRMTQYAALPKGAKGKLSTQQLAFLNAEIDRTEARMKQWQARQQQQAGSGGNPGGAGPGRAQGRASGGSRGGDRQGAGGPPGGGGGSRGASGSGMTREERQLARLDRSSATSQANRSQYFSDMNQARKLRGLPPLEPGRRGFRRR